MKAYHLYFIILRFIVLIQIILVFLKKHTKDSDIYIISDTIFKLSIALYLFIFFMIHSFPGLELGDVIILRFSGLVLLFDIDFTGLLRVIRKYIPSLPKVPYLEK
jgi:hypothetical protein